MSYKALHMAPGNLLSKLITKASKDSYVCCTPQIDDDTL